MGSTNLNNTSVALRMLENQLTPYVDQMTNYVNWVIDMTNAEYDMDLCHIKFTNFKLIDDIMKMQLLAQMSGTGNVSKTTIQEILGLDPQKERDQVKKDTIDASIDQKEVEHEIQQIQQNITTQVQDEQAAQETGNIPKYNQRQMIANAQSMAQQLMTIPYEERKSKMSDLQNEDYIMWSIVRAQLETLHNAQKTQAAQDQMVQQ